YRQLVTSKYNTFLNSNKTATQNGKYDLSYAFYDVTVNPNSIQNYSKTSKGAMVKGSYLVYMRISDGKTSYLFPLRDLTLSDGTNMENTGTLPSGFEVINQKTRELRYVVNKSSSTTNKQEVTGIPSNAIPDLASWAGSNYVTKKMYKSGDGAYYYTDYYEEIIIEYTELLEKYGFKLVDHYKASEYFENDIRESWAFVKEGYPDSALIKGSWLDEKGHFVIERYKDGKRSFNVDFDSDFFQLYDIGERRDGSSATPGAITVVEKDNSNSSTTVNLNVGETAGVSYTWKKFGTDYNVYTWEIVSGADYVSIIDSVGDTCRFKAKSKGTAILRVKYDYTEEGTDVLTGNKRTKHRSKTQDYKIVVK
ncbi:MAG: hypothetical protein IKM20_06440, partial [Erysipelotrichales bacterium]|nr:hypothetical protein [Erysipelotrichales bacterium]